MPESRLDVAETLLDGDVEELTRARVISRAIGPYSSYRQAPSIG